MASHNNALYLMLDPFVITYAEAGNIFTFVGWFVSLSTRLLKKSWADFQETRWMYEASGTIIFCIWTEHAWHLVEPNLRMVLGLVSLDLNLDQFFHFFSIERQGFLSIQ